MDRVRTAFRAVGFHLYGCLVPAERRIPVSRRWSGRGNPDGDIPVLDLICVVGIIALGAIVALVGRGVEKL